MFSRDANNATWYLLRYATDFAPRARSGGGAVPTIPALSASLFYDDARHVLELLPAAPAEERAPLPALAVDVTGEAYRANSDGRLVVVRCDGSEKVIVCGTDVLGVPGGLALDRPEAHRARSGCAIRPAARAFRRRGDPGRARR